jgi:hypothetical protein
MTNINQLTKEKVDRDAWLAIAEKIGQIAEAESREADQNGRFSPKVAEAILEGGINNDMGVHLLIYALLQILLEPLPNIVWQLHG